MGEVFRFGTAILISKGEARRQNRHATRHTISMKRGLIQARAAPA